MLVNTYPDAIGSGDQGAVSVEFALTIGTFVCVFIMLLLGLQATLTQIRLNHATASAATWVARGEDLVEVEQMFQQMTPPAASLSVKQRGDWVVVEGIAAAPALFGKVLPALRAQYQLPTETWLSEQFGVS